MSWIGLKRRVIDKKGAGVHVIFFNPCDLIGMFFGSICDKEVVETHDKRKDYFKDYVVNVPGDNMERTLGMGTQCVNNRSQSTGS